MAAKTTNVVLRPNQTLKFPAIPAGQIEGLSRVGVHYRIPPPSTRFERAKAAAIQWLREALGIKPAPVKGWCETTLAEAVDESR